MSIPFLLGMLWGINSENKKMQKEEEIDFENIDISKVEEALFNARVIQLGEENYYTGEQTYEDKETLQKVDEKSFHIIVRLVGNADINRDEVHHLITQLAK